MRRIPALTATVLAIAALLIPSTAWAADGAGSEMQDAVETVIAEYGGEQTGWNEVTWDDGDVVLTIEPEGFAPFAVGNCATGRYCVYDGQNRTGSKLSFTSCANHSVSPLGSPVRSMANGLCQVS